MDGIRFDSLTRAIRYEGSRRSAIRLLLGLVPGAMIGISAVLSPEDAAACVALNKRCRKKGRKGKKGKRRQPARCCGGATCLNKRCTCTGGKVDCNGACADLLKDPRHCGDCGRNCPSGGCLNGTCICDPFNNQCPMSADGQCGCGAAVGEEFVAACVDRFSACDLDRPCETNEECGPGSVCLLGCADPPAPNPRRCSTPCVPV